MTKELEQKVAALEEALQGITTISLAYLPTGALLSAAIGGEGDLPALKAAKAALMNLAMRVDEQIYRALPEQEPN